MSSYNAPALEKGLDIIEHLASSAAPLSMSQLAQRLGRTVPEIYRMIQVLHDRGYVETEGHGHVVTSRAFCLGLGRPDVLALLAAAAPEMERLGRTTGKACYLTAAGDDVVVVIAAQPSFGDLGVDVRLGTRQPVLDTAAGQVHFAFSPDARKETWRQGLTETEAPARLARFLKDAGQAALSGQAERAHRHMDCLTEISCPVTGPRDQVYALSLLYLHTPDGPDLMSCRPELAQAARRITQDLRFHHASPDKAPQAVPRQVAEVCGH